MNLRLLSSFVLLFKSGILFPLVTGNVAFVFDFKGKLERFDQTLSDNIFISNTLDRLLVSQATPMVLNGSLARIVLTFFAADECTGVGALPGKSALAAAYACQRAGRRTQAVKCAIDGMLNAAWHRLSCAAWTEKPKIMQQLMSFDRWAYDYTAKYVDTFGGPGFGQLAALPEKVCKTAWQVYVYGGPYGLVVLVPRAYQQRMIQNAGSCLATVGFNLGAARAQGTLRDAARLIPAISDQAGSITDALNTVFNRNAPLGWHVLLVGHGSPTDAQVPGSELLRAGGNGRIAGLPAVDFLQLMLWCNTMRVQTVVWQTCHGGGYHAQCVADILAHMRASTRVPLRYVPVSVAPDDGPTYVKLNANMQKFFTHLNTAPVGEHNFAKLPRPELCSCLVRALRHLTDDSPIALFPGERSFVRFVV